MSDFYIYNLVELSCYLKICVDSFRSICRQSYLVHMGIIIYFSFQLIPGVFVCLFLH